MIHRRDHEVYRDDIDAPAFDTDGRHPGGEHLAHLLDQLEEVVGPVDLVHFAGARVADDDCRTEDAPRDPALLADDAFGVVLGAEVGILEVLRFVEHVFTKQPFEKSGGGNRADQVEVSGSNFLCQADGVAGAVHVGALLIFGAGLEVIDRREMEKVFDLAMQLVDIGPRDAQVYLRQVADDRNDAAIVTTPILVQFLQPRQLNGASQEIDGSLGAAQQSCDKSLADETSGAGNEVIHCCLLMKFIVLSCVPCVLDCSLPEAIP